MSKIAGRYLFARKTNDVITWISRISVLGIAIGTAALIVVMSVFNGFTHLIESNIDSSSPTYRIVPQSGKTYSFDDSLLTALKELEGVSLLQMVVEDMVAVEYGDVKSVVKLKGLPEASSFSISAPIARKLGLKLSFLSPIELYYPQSEGKISLTNPALNHIRGRATSILNSDEELVVVPLAQARELLSLSENQASALEIYCYEGSQTSQKLLQELLGEELRVENRYQQHSQIYKMMRYEKLAVYLILFFIILVVAVNIYASLSMLIMEKELDIIHLRAMGASKALVRRIFCSEGMLVCALGLALGIIIGLLLVYAQSRWGLVRLPGNSMTAVYPVQLKISDLLLSVGGVALIGGVIANLSTKKI
ncbi:MAG: FtsX-like permease family protein [Candidatus Cryptobacteroides sp.]